MASQDPVINSLSGRIAGLSRAAGAPPKRQAPDGCVPAEKRAEYLMEVDPAGALPLRERQRRAAAAWKRDKAVDELRAYRAGRTAPLPGGDAA